jgi:hypothetical protein
VVTSDLAKKNEIYVGSLQFFSKAVPWSRRIASGFEAQRRWFEPTLSHVRSVLDKAEL